ncbi:hypothetical protein Tco_0079831 [Tanacetum coccineum]
MSGIIADLPLSAMLVLLEPRLTLSVTNLSNASGSIVGASVVDTTFWRHYVRLLEVMRILGDIIREKSEELSLEIEEKTSSKFASRMSRGERHRSALISPAVKYS